MGKKKILQPPENANSVNIATNISQSEIKKMIVEAYFEIEKQKEEIRISEQGKWQKIIGYKEYDENEKYGKTKRFWNDLCVLSKMVYINKQNVKEGIATAIIMKMFLLLLFTALKWISLIVSITAIILIFINPLKIVIAIYIGISIFFFLLFVIFRMASIEVDNMKDRSYLVAIFSGITSFIALIVAAIALINGIS